MLRRDRLGDKVAVVTRRGEVISDGVTVGAGAGSILALVASTGALAVPGIGPFLAMGPLAATLGGATAGGIVGALADLGMPDNPAHRALPGVEGDEAALVVETKDPARVAGRLRDEGALSIKTVEERGEGDA